MIVVDRVSRKINGPLLVPSIKQLSYALSKHFGLDLKVVNMKYITFGIIEVGIDNNKGVYYEGTFDLVHRRLNIKNAFLSYKFFLTNYGSNLVLEDIKRIDKFKFEIVYSKGEEKYSDTVDVSNIKKVLVQKKSWKLYKIKFFEVKEENYYDKSFTFLAKNILLFLKAKETNFLFCWFNYWYSAD